jgi:pimeloyl-ACP methyl ester carboxylesterase
MSRMDQQIQLADGRKLGFDEYGPVDGSPVFYFHGTPSSRIEGSLFGSQALAEALHIRLIIPDRPGMGLSNYLPGRRIGDWPADVAALAAHLGLDRFAILGYSGGGPYALACAQAIPEHLARVAVVSGAGPLDQPGLADGIPAANLRFLYMARDHPWRSRLMLRSMGFITRFAGKRMTANANAGLPESDRLILSRPEMQGQFLKMVQEALRQGPRGAQHDSCLMVSPWDFRPQDIRMHVELWHGEQDRNAPPAMGRFVAGLIPDSRIHFSPDDGHLSLIANQLEGILQYLVS